MDERMLRALAEGARAFADAIEVSLHAAGEATAATHPTPGSAASMREVLGAVARINDEENRGATDTEMRSIAVRAGMDPRGMAGYYTSAAQLLKKRTDGRWVTDVGRERLARLTALGDAA